MPKEVITDYETREVQREVTRCEFCGDEDTPHKAFSNVKLVEVKSRRAEISFDGVAWFCDDCHEDFFHDDDSAHHLRADYEARRSKDNVDRLFRWLS